MLPEFTTNGMLALYHVEYGLSKRRGKLCSTCELFTSIDVSFIPIGRIVKTGGVEAVRSYYQNFGDNFYQELMDMLVFDAISLNER